MKEEETEEGEKTPWAHEIWEGMLERQAKADGAGPAANHPYIFKVSSKVDRHDPEKGILRSQGDDDAGSLPPSGLLLPKWEPYAPKSVDRVIPEPRKIKYPGKAPIKPAVEEAATALR